APPAGGLAIPPVFPSIDRLLRRIFHVAGGLVDLSFALQLSVARQATERFLHSTFRFIFLPTHLPPSFPALTKPQWYEGGSNVPSQIAHGAGVSSTGTWEVPSICGKSFRVFLENRADFRSSVPSLQRL